MPTSAQTNGEKKNNRIGAKHSIFSKFAIKSQFVGSMGPA
jgi:hypothetical protein